MVTKHRPSFDPKSFIARVGDGRSICKYRKGQVVFSQGDPGDAVFYIQKGRAKLTVVSEHGKEVVIAILGVEEFFGEGCLAGQAQRIATVTTMTDSVIARLEKSTNIQVIHQEPAFSEKLICASSGSEHPCRSRSYRSTIQFKREASCSHAPAVGKLRHGRDTGACDREN
jgi:CRP/FNR family transcriptional regulator, cyclic AMP receptor protein